MPVAVIADGNCMFCMMSMAAFCTQDVHLLLLVFASLEIAENQHMYDKASAMCHPLLRRKETVSPAYELLLQVSSVGKLCCVDALLVNQVYYFSSTLQARFHN